VPVILLLIGVLLGLYSLAVMFGREQVAASRPLRHRSRRYAAVTGGLGVGFAVVGIAGLAGAY
jgi:hypothetical protein